MHSLNGFLSPEQFCGNYLLSDHSKLLLNLSVIESAFYWHVECWQFWITFPRCPALALLQMVGMFYLYICGCTFCIWIFVKFTRSWQKLKLLNWMSENYLIKIGLNVLQFINKNGFHGFQYHPAERIVGLTISNVENIWAPRWRQKYNNGIFNGGIFQNLATIENLHLKMAEIKAKVNENSRIQYLLNLLILISSLLIS